MGKNRKIKSERCKYAVRFSNYIIEFNINSCRAELVAVRLNLSNVILSLSKGYKPLTTNPIE